MRRRALGGDPVRVSDELEQAWDQVYDVLPFRWFVVKPVHHPERGYWVAFARNPHARKTDPPFVEAIGPTESEALVELARCIREVLAGRVPR